jgi:predicted transcriptional regulator
MTVPVFDQLVDLMDDEKALKILFYLREFNPNVTIDDLIEHLNFSREDVTNGLKKLETLELIENKNSKFKLTEIGKIVINGFYHNIGETPSKNKIEET